MRSCDFYGSKMNMAFHMQVSCRRVRNTTHSGVGG